LEVIINGESRVIEPGATIAGLLGQLGIEPRLVAVERNEQLVPRRRHAETLLESGDRIEIVTLVGGG
jgi:thiamine biosynthesis protein ThiS